MFMRVRRSIDLISDFFAAATIRHRGSADEFGLENIRWWQSWGYDPFDPEWGYTPSIYPNNQADWNRMVDEVIRMSDPGPVRESPREIVIQNDWRYSQEVPLINPSIIRVAFPEPVTVHAGESLDVEYAFRVDGTHSARVIQERDEIRRRVKVDGVWMDEAEYHNGDEPIPDL